MPAVLADTVGPTLCCTAFGAADCADATVEDDMTATAARIEMNFRFTDWLLLAS
jgi:hypothetical protein